MGTDDHILISLSGEGPWGFRLQGGSEKSLPLLVSKVRKRSKACRGGLRENDELVSINGKVCAGLSHAEAMLMIDSSGSNLYLRVKRAGAGAQTVPRPHRSQDPPSSWAVSSSSKSTPGQPKLLHLESITSPPDSEAYYGETDSDADFQTSPGHPQSTQQHHSQQQLPPEKHRRARKKSPRSPPGTNMKTETEQQSLSEMSGYESGPGCVSECAVVPTGGVAKREITYQPGGSRAETPFSDVEGFLPAEEEQQLSSVSAPSPESLLLPHATKTIRAERHLIPMIGPVDHPVDEDLTTSYSEKAKEAKLHRSESVQEKNVKEARTKCRTIASLLTDAPNPHSKGVLMFKKRRQRAKKYTLVSYGSVDEDRYNEDEDGVFPTSESEFDEEGFSDARSLTNHSDWDSTYLDIEKPKMEHEHQEEKGLSEASGKGAEMFEMQRQRSEQFSVDAIPPQNPQEHQTARPVPPQRRTASARSSVNVERSQDTGSSESTKVACTNISLSTSQPTQGSNVEASAAADGIFNRSARPFTPGQVVQRTVASSVTFNPSTQKRVSECVQNLTPSPFTQFSPTALVNTQKASGSSVASLYIPAPGKPTVSSTTQHSEGTRASEIPSVAITPRTTTASIYLSSPLRPSGPQTESSQPAASKITDPTPVTPLAHPASHVVSPASSVLKEAPSFTTPVTSLNLSPESVTSREQRISVPVGRTGILNEARKRGGKKQMFAKVEEKKCLPNPELLSMVQNLDEKPKQDQPGTGFESGPEEDFLSLGAEACNFMQSSARKLKVPPPVAPKPSLKATPEQLVNGNQDMPQLKGKGAELFAKRQSRMDKFVVDSTRSSSSRPNSRPRTPSPTPSLPSAWKYSSNIRAPPPIAYNPIHSPFYPLAASKSQPSKVESKVKKSPAGKARMQAIDFMRHQPYQLNSAMFCFGDSSNTTNQNPPSQETGKSHLLITPARQAPVKTARTHDIKRFSTPTPMSSSVNMAPTVLTPRSATTLAEPVWRTDATCQSMPVPSAVTPTPYQTPPQGVLQNFDTVENRAATVLSPTSSITSPRSSISRIQVPKPRFSASKIGIQANVWRPAKVTF